MFVTQNIFTRRKVPQVSNKSIGMAELVSISDFIGFPLKCFKAVAYPFFEENFLRPSNWIERIRNLLLYFYYAFVALTFLSLQVQMLVLMSKSGDLAIFTTQVPLFISIAVFYIKLIFISWKKPQMKDLLATLTKLFPATKEEQEAYDVKNYLPGYKRFERIFAFALNLDGILFNLAPIIDYFKTGLWYRKLPFENWFPFDEFDPRYYHFVYAWFIFATATLNLSCLAADCLLLSFITLIAMEFDILGKKLRNIAKNKNVSELVERHKTLMRLSDDLEEIYSFSILVNFTGSSIFLCLVAFELSIGVDPEILSKLMSFLVSSIIQMWLLCFYGQKLIDASEKVADEAYNSDWYETDNKDVKRAVQLIILQSRRPACLTALKFSKVSLEAFSTVSFSQGFIDIQKLFIHRL